MRPGAEMDCPLQTVDLCLLKRILGVERTTPHWSVLRECGFEPLHIYWFRSAVRSYNASLTCNSLLGITLRKTEQFCTRQPINLMDFVVDFRKRHRSVWPTEDQAEHDGHPNKLAKYHNWVALPFRLQLS
eukprot:1139837-Pelagomonas_calceolata.AAC.1